MKFTKHLILAAALAMAACGRSDGDGKKPDEPKTCDGQPWGKVETPECPAGQVGNWTRVCGDNGWQDVANTCKAAPEPDKPTPPPPPPPPPPKTCDGEPLGTFKYPKCPVGQIGDWVQQCSETGWKDVYKGCHKPDEPPPPPPPPPPELKVDLPSVYRIRKGEPLRLGLRSQQGVTFQWSDGQAGELVWVQPGASKPFTVTATRASDGVKASASSYVLVE